MGMCTVLPLTRLQLERVEKIHPFIHLEKCNLEDSMKNTMHILVSMACVCVLTFLACEKEKGNTLLPVGGGGPSGDTVVSIAAIPGVVVPVRGATPAVTPLETAQYTGLITWSPNDNPFKPGTKYTAYITLAPKNGFTLNGVAANLFTVAGADSVANSADSGIVSAVFPKTGAAQDIDVTFQKVTEIGGASGTADSTGLLLYFDKKPDTLTADNITVTGATRGILSGPGTIMYLAISNVTVANGATVAVTITSPSGYAITGSPQTVVVYRYNAPVTFVSAVQTGGASGTADSTGLTLTFDVDTTLTTDNITVTGATKGALTGGGTTWDLAISNVTVDDGATVSVAITSPAGYAISGSAKTAVVYRLLAIGRLQQGGVIAYIYQSGDPGYVAGQVHGIIAATSDLNGGTKIAWMPHWGGAEYQYVQDGTGTALGTGSVNTDRIIAQAEAYGNHDRTSYAAGLARAYNGGGYTDWYLPSKDELNNLCINQAAIGGFSDDSFNHYWSSSENYASTAWFQRFYNSAQANNNKYDERRVRAVRSF
jgi:hypothetical protein